MRDIIQIASNTDKQLTMALLRSVWLSYLLSVGSTSAGALSVFSVAAVLGSEPAQANPSELSASLPERTVEDEAASDASSAATELDELVEEKISPAAEEESQAVADIALMEQQHELPNFEVVEGSEQEKAEVQEVRSSEFGNSGVRKFETKEVSEQQLPEQVAVGREPATLPEALVPKPPVAAPMLHSVEYHLPGDVAVADEPATVPEALVPKPPVVVLDEVDHQKTEQVALAEESAAVPEALVPKLPVAAPMLHSVEYHLPGDVTVADEPAAVPEALVPKPPVGESQLLAQSAGENAPDASLIPENSPSKNEALTPTLDVQGVYLNQGDDAARLRLRGIYPVSPNALFGAIVDLATGDDFAGTEGSGIGLSELYFTGSLPSYPNLRLTTGLMDLTSYFDRNSFAKDSTTHFFHPLLQTNPALASAGIGSRVGALLNWNVTDNVEAKAAVFSSERNLGDFSLDAFAGEIGFRAGYGIVRATYATNKDTGRDGVFGTRDGDREHAFGINGELYIPQIKMGLFARYGWLKNSDRDDDLETYNFGLNFLDLFLKDDRLGLGYAFGRDFSEDNDVWELFYDVRVARNLRAGVVLQEREGFSETILGFRVKTDWQLYP
ncbi:MAG TPA: hypothetical protein DDZ80_11655 [Cyanobacteria bacterium UBA8803]|nr:hypothetical protein [Cyanobacteria bacterium UBA9273]HBL59140.1 hypothetical protein [Cyanobacteria bacterium UBA8803]